MVALVLFVGVVVIGLLLYGSARWNVSRAVVTTVASQETGASHEEAVFDTDAVEGPGPPADTAPSFPPLTVIRGSLGKEGTLYDALRAQNVAPETIGLIVSQLRPIVDFRSCQRDDRFSLWLTEGGAVERFEYCKGPLDVYELIRAADGGYEARKQDIAIDRYLVKVRGEIQSSLFETISQLGEQDQLAIMFADIFAWEIDFFQDLRSGDVVTILVEKIYKDDQFVQYGRIVAAEYRQASRIHQGFYFEGTSGRGDYFDEKGYSLRRAFLRAPLQFRRISSGFTHSRPHPILGGSRPHYGIDYAAPTGTPVWSVADGLVTEKGWNKAYGNYVAIRHPQGYTTYYGHFSRFAKGIAKGVRVRQKQIIGYVGATGYATGPHLDYRLKRHGRYRNPLKEQFPAGTPVPKDELSRFMELRVDLAGLLQDDTFSVKELSTRVK